MMKTVKVLPWVMVLVLATPLLAANQADLARSATVGIDVSAVSQDLKAAGHPAEDVELVAKQLQALQGSAPGDASAVAPAAQTPATLGTPQTPATLGTPQTPATLGTPQTPGTQSQREQVAALGRELSSKGVPERLIHPALWAIQDRRFPRVDPTPLFAQMRSMSLDPTSVQKMTDSKIRVYAKDRTDVAEAQYEFISNSLYLPPDYLEPGASPPRLKTQLSTSELNTVIHELDHAEKDQLTNDSEVFGKNLAGAMLAGVRKVALASVGTGFAGLALSAIPKLATIAPAVALTAMGALVVGGAAWGAYKWWTSRDKNPRTPQEQAALEAVSGIADVIRRDPTQKTAMVITEARSKAWEVSGYFMGDSVSDMLEQIDTIKLHQHRRIRQAKTKEEVEAILASVELPPHIADRKFGDSTRGGSAWFRVKEVNFPYKDHPELFTKLYSNSLGMQPPADARELVARINADPTVFPQLREYMRMHADRRLKELATAGGGTPSPAPSAAPSAAPPVDRSTPNFTDVPVTR